MRIQRGWWNIRQRERTRIARELHDTLLQSTQGIIFVFQRIMEDLPPAAPARLRAKAALDQAEQLLREARDGLSALRTHHPACDVPRSLKNASEALFVDDPGIVRVSLHGQPRDLATAVITDVCRIGREALANAARHARATMIRAECWYEEANFRLRVWDNGIGVDLSAIQHKAAINHYGILGMRERARAIRGDLAISRRLGGGTLVELTVPAPQAYRDAPRNKASQVPALPHSRNVNSSALEIRS